MPERRVDEGRREELRARYEKCAPNIEAAERERDEAIARAIGQSARRAAAEQRERVQVLEEELAAARDVLLEIALFRDGKRVERQAHLLRERARIAVADLATRAAFREERLDEIESLWRDYCDGDLSLGALAQELGEVLAEGPVQEEER